MTLKQKLAIAFFRTKIKSIAIVSPKKAARVAFKLFCTPYSGKPLRKMPAIFEQAERVDVTVKKIKVLGFKFLPNQSNGKTILIAHGFDSHCYKFEHFIKPLTHLGYTVLLFDAPGHGRSEGKTLHSLQYRETIWAINKKYGELHTIIAHSIGALAASFAAEQLPTLQNLILIAPPENINKPIADFSKLLKISTPVYNAFIALINQIAKVPVSWFSVARALQQIRTNTLWIHDKDDTVCLFTDIQPVMQLHLPYVEFYITEGLGHSKVYRKKSTVTKIIDFIQATNN